MNRKKLPQELKSIVSWTVSLLGKAIQQTHGKEFYNLIEKNRENLRDSWSGDHRDWQKDLKTLLTLSKKLNSLSEDDRLTFAHCNTCLLELLNRCEAAYRSYRLGQEHKAVQPKKDHAVIFVLTAHPTEARGPEFLSVFSRISELIIESFEKKTHEQEEQIFYLLQVLLRVPLARNEKPQVIDEAKNIYDFTLHKEIISLLIKLRQQGTNVMLRTWAGGDKDGHPGVDEKTMLESLQLSRLHLLKCIDIRLQDIESELKLMTSLKDQVSLLNEVALLIENNQKLKLIQKEDGLALHHFRDSLNLFKHSFEKKVGIQSPVINEVLDLFWLFPALVLPLEIREDSTVVKQSLTNPKDFAIGRMLLKLAEISQGLEPKWYVRGFVLSMCESVDDIFNGMSLSEKTLGEQTLPIVPLFETENALVSGHDILNSLFLQRPKLIELHQTRWGGRFEVMLGYSDSSKESGVLPSRFLIFQAMEHLDKVVKLHTLTPIFFHGSGGSVERGGGSIQEQIEWWPPSALKSFKATYQGETVARTFATPEIFLSTVQKISEQWHRKPAVKMSKASLSALELFAGKVKASYRQAVHNPEFLQLVEQASPYLFLSQLNIGSRPTKRSSQLEVSGLRAIPWILCWTQTRVLFPTWWGLGRAWKSLNSQEKKQMQKAYKESKLFSSFIKSLGFTLSKVELAVWRFYLEESSLEKAFVDSIFDEFLDEYATTLKFYRQLTGEKNLMWHRPWLKESIALRSPMIHPLNVLQVIAVQKNDPYLLRKTVTGISCGMLTTG